MHNESKPPPRERKYNAASTVRNNEWIAVFCVHLFCYEIINS